MIREPNILRCGVRFLLSRLAIEEVFGGSHGLAYAVAALRESARFCCHRHPDHDQSPCVKTKSRHSGGQIGWGSRGGDTTEFKEALMQPI